MRFRKGTTVEAVVMAFFACYFFFLGLWFFVTISMQSGNFMGNIIISMKDWYDFYQVDLRQTEINPS